MPMKACKECKKEISSRTDKCPNCGVKNPTISDQILAFIYILIISPIVIPVVYFITADTPAPRPPVQPKNLESRILEGAIDMITKEAYPKTYTEWGASKLKWLNNLQTPAAKYALQNYECDYVISVALSPSKSFPPEVAIFNVDCKNRMRFLIANEFLE